MPNEKDRKKKDGENTGKKNQRMREAVQERKAHAGPEGEQTDEGDIMEYKPGSAGDRTRVGAT